MFHANHCHPMILLAPTNHPLRYFGLSLSLSLFTFSLAQRRRVGLHLEPCLERVSGHLPRQCGARLPSQRGPGGTVTMNVEGTVTKSTCHVPRATVRNWGLVREDWWCR